MIFNHPLKHLGKTIDDLPLLLIDNFQEILLFPDFNRITFEFIRFIEDYRMKRFGRTYQSVFVRLSPNSHRYSFRDEL